MREIEDPDKGKDEVQEQNLPEQKRSELEALERELASKKAAASAYEAVQAKQTEVSTTNAKQD